MQKPPPRDVQSGANCDITVCLLQFSLMPWSRQSGAKRRPKSFRMESLGVQSAPNWCRACLEASPKGPSWAPKHIKIGKKVVSGEVLGQAWTKRGPKWLPGSHFYGCVMLLGQRFDTFSDVARASVRYAWMSRVRSVRLWSTQV